MQHNVRNVNTHRSPVPARYGDTCFCSVHEHRNEREPAACNQRQSTFPSIAGGQVPRLSRRSMFAGNKGLYSGVPSMPYNMQPRIQRDKSLLNAMDRILMHQIPSWRCLIPPTHHYSAVSLSIGSIAQANPTQICCWHYLLAFQMIGMSSSNFYPC